MKKRNYPTEAMKDGPSFEMEFTPPSPVKAMPNKKTYLITGGAGFIGSALAQYLILAGHEVCVLDNFVGGREENIPEECHVQDCCLLFDPEINQLFEEMKFDAVFHCAAFAAEGLSHFTRLHTYEVNVVGSMNIINACVRYDVKHLTFLSSIAVYGTIPTPMKETDRPRPEDPYGISKLAVEMDIEAAHRMFGLNYTIFRPHNVYGPRQSMSDPHRNVIAIFLKKALLGEDLVIFGDGHQRRAFSYIYDVVPYIAAAPEDENLHNTVFNIGTEESMSVLELARLIISITGSRSQIVHTEARKEVPVAFSSQGRLEAVFEEAGEHTSLPWGIENTLQWVKEEGLENLIKPIPDPPVIEIRKNIPGVWVKP